MQGRDGSAGVVAATPRMLPFPPSPPWLCPSTGAIFSAVPCHSLPRTLVTTSLSLCYKYLKYKRNNGAISQAMKEVIWSNTHSKVNPAESISPTKILETDWHMVSGMCISASFTQNMNAQSAVKYEWLQSEWDLKNISAKNHCMFSVWVWKPKKIITAIK